MRPQCIFERHFSLKSVVCKALAAPLPSEWTEHHDRRAARPLHRVLHGAGTSDHHFFRSQCGSGLLLQRADPCQLVDTSSRADAPGHVTSLSSVGAFSFDTRLLAGRSCLGRDMSGFGVSESSEKSEAHQVECVVSMRHSSGETCQNRSQHP